MEAAMSAISAGPPGSAGPSGTRGISGRVIHPRHSVVDGITQSNASMALDKSAYIDISQEVHVNGNMNNNMNNNYDHQQAQYGQPYSNLNSMGGLPPPMANLAPPGSSRNGSLTSGVSFNRFMKSKFSRTANRNGHRKNKESKFDDDDFNGDGNINTNITEPDMSFDDLKHIRGGGRYGMGASAFSLDASSYVPMFNIGPSTSSKPGANSYSPISNESYRKQQVTHKKMMAMRYSRLSQTQLQGGQGGASLGPGGEMYPPRTMSLQTFGQGNRQVMPMNGPGMQQMNGLGMPMNGPGAPMNGPGAPMNGPINGPMHLNSLGGGGVPPNMPPMGGYPHTMSMQSAGYYGRNGGPRQRFMPPQSQFMRPPFGSPKPDMRRVPQSTSQSSLQQSMPGYPNPSYRNNSLTQRQQPMYSGPPQGYQNQQQRQPMNYPAQRFHQSQSLEDLPESDSQTQETQVPPPQSRSQFSQIPEAPPIPEVLPILLPQRQSQKPMAAPPDHSSKPAYDYNVPSSRETQEVPIHSRDPSSSLVAESYSSNVNQAGTLTSYRSDISLQHDQAPKSMVSTSPPHVFQPQAGKVKVNRYVFTDSEDEENDEDESQEGDGEQSRKSEGQYSTDASNSNSMESPIPQRTSKTASSTTDAEYFSVEKVTSEGIVSPSGSYLKELGAPALMNDNSSYASSSTSYDSDSIRKTPDITLKHDRFTDSGDKAMKVSGESFDFTSSPGKKDREILLPDGDNDGETSSARGNIEITKHELLDELNNSVRNADMKQGVLTPPAEHHKIKSMIPDYLNEEFRNGNSRAQESKNTEIPSWTPSSSDAVGAIGTNVAGLIASQSQGTSQTDSSNSFLPHKKSSDVTSASNPVYSNNKVPSYTQSVASTSQSRATSGVSSASFRKAPPPLPKDGVEGYQKKNIILVSPETSSNLQENHHKSNSTLSSIENAFARSPKMAGAKNFFLKITQRHRHHSSKGSKSSDKDAQEAESFKVYPPLPNASIGQPLGKSANLVEEKKKSLPPEPLAKDNDPLLNYRLTLNIPRDDNSDHRLTKFLEMDNYSNKTPTESILPKRIVGPVGDKFIPKINVRYKTDLKEYLQPSQLGVLNDNTKLLKELQIVSTELAGSISRELTLEGKLRAKSLVSASILKETENGSKVSELTEQLNEERRKRYATEEMILKRSDGVSDNSQMTEMGYKNSSLSKKIVELEDQLQSEKMRTNLLEEERDKLKSSLEDMSKKYRDLTNNVVPELQNQVEILSNSNNPQNSLEERLESLQLENESLKQQQISESDEVTVLKSQRDSFREALKNLKIQRDIDFRMNAEKVKSQEHTVNKLSSINGQLSRKLLATGLMGRGEISIVGSPSIRTNTSFEDSPLME
ncbi:hypothetical protein FOA43_002202 [Brettanomyces nanus]|uniref:Uncharacterized protein n=1 Tax=Eeniella nana TaxID=13502 RepID=A0A875S0D1_EENNA|nr:uncharacterized protein FOA43_002202 [Brettanomyces nanus]QPG74866.1 hypothetical protein FOA43_002202 [Brettanomyces nanus]